MEPEPKKKFSFLDKNRNNNSQNNKNQSGSNPDDPFSEEDFDHREGNDSLHSEEANKAPSRKFSQRSEERTNEQRSDSKRNDFDRKSKKETAESDDFYEEERENKGSNGLKGEKNNRQESSRSGKTDSGKTPSFLSRRDRPSQKQERTYEEEQNEPEYSDEETDKADKPVKRLKSDSAKKRKRNIADRPTIFFQYKHISCGGVTAISEYISRWMTNPFRPISGTHCSTCGSDVSTRAVSFLNSKESVSEFRRRIMWHAPRSFYLVLFIAPFLIAFVLATPVGKLFDQANKPSNGFWGGFFITLFCCILFWGGLLSRIYGLDFRKIDRELEGIGEVPVNLGDENDSLEATD